MNVSRSVDRTACELYGVWRVGAVHPGSGRTGQMDGGCLRATA